MTTQQPDVAGAVLALDQAMIALAVAKSALLGETSAPMPVPLASLREREHYDAGSAAQVAEGVDACPATLGDRADPVRCVLASGHQGLHETVAGALWPGRTESAAEVAEVPEGVEPFPHFPHLPQHTNGSRVCGLCGIDHDAAARLAPPAAYQLPSASITVDGA